MLGKFEATKLKTIFTTEDGGQVEVTCNKVPDDADDAWYLIIGCAIELSLYKKAQLISELLAKDEINAISYTDYDKAFTLSGKMTIEQVLVEMSKKM